MEDIEKLLKGAFIGAANQLTQLYVQGLQQQKQSFAIGYNSAIENVIQFVINNSTDSSPHINLELLLDFLKKERGKYSQPSTSSPDLKNDGNDVPSSSSSSSPTSSASITPSATTANNSADGFHFQPPAAPSRPATDTDDIFTFSASNTHNPPLLSPTFSFNTATAQQSQTPTPPLHRQHRHPSTPHARLLQQSQTETASRKRQIDLIFNPSIIEVLKPMDKLLKKIKIDQ